MKNKKIKFNKKIFILYQVYSLQFTLWQKVNKIKG